MSRRGVDHRCTFDLVPSGDTAAAIVHMQQEIVLVEDDGAVRQALARVLSGSGFAVRAFESAETLLAELRDATWWPAIRCCICDVRLPGASAFELYRDLALRGPMSPWIIITSHDAPSVREHAERIHAAYLMKPFEGRTLLAMVARVAAPTQLP
ncbi:response regulator [Lysobacter sp. HA35]